MLTLTALGAATASVAPAAALGILPLGSPTFGNDSANAGLDHPPTGPTTHAPGPAHPLLGLGG